MICWHNGAFVRGPVMVGSDNFSLHYGPCIWEGIRGYVQRDGRTVKVFKLEEHVNRLFDSMKALGIEVTYSKVQIIGAIRELVKKNGVKDCYIRPLVYNTDTYAALQQVNKEYNFDIYISDIGKEKSSGIDLITSTYQRSYPNMPMQCKVSSNYLIGQLAEAEAARSGVDDALLMDKNGFYTESSVGNLFIVKNGIIMTPPNEGSILPGITRSTIMSEILANTSIMFAKYKMHVGIINKNITRADLYTADEVFLCGTFMEVTPIKSIDGITFGDNLITTIVQNEYLSLVRNYG